MNALDFSDELICTFRTMAKTVWKPGSYLVEELVQYLEKLEVSSLKSRDELQIIYINVLNERLDINKGVYRRFINAAARLGVTFNYHEKLMIESAIDDPRLTFPAWLSTSIKSTVDLHHIAYDVEASRNVEAMSIDLLLGDDKKKDDAIESVFCSFVYNCVDEELVHKALNDECRVEEYLEDYWDHLKVHHKAQVTRSRRLAHYKCNHIVWS